MINFNLCIKQAALLFCAVLLSACQTISALSTAIDGKEVFETVDHRMIDEVPERYIEKPGAKTDGGFFSKILNSSSDMLQDVQLSTRSLTNEEYIAQRYEETQKRAEQTLSFEGVKVLENYAQNIISNLLENYPHEKPDVTIQITNNQLYTSSINPDNVIQVPIGVFIQATNEDEVAAILAHELAHALLGHQHVHEHADKERATHESITMLGVLSSAAQNDPNFKIFGTRAELNNNKLPSEARNLLLAAVVAQELHQKILLPKWHRDQEKEADILGADLLFDAGYVHSQMRIVLQRLQSQQVKSVESIEKTQEAAKQKLVKFIPTGNNSYAMDFGFTDALSNMFAELSDSHGDPKQREQNLINYFSKPFYEDAFDDFSALPALKRKEFEEIVWEGAARQFLQKSIYGQRAQVLYDDGQFEKAEKYALAGLNANNDPNPDIRRLLFNLRKQAGKNKLAAKNLEIALTGKNPPSDLYQLLYLHYNETSDHENALRILDWQHQYTGLNIHEYFLQRLKLLNHLSQHDEVNQLLEQCRIAEIEAECSNALMSAQEGNIE